VGDVPNARAIVYENTYRLKPEKKCVWLTQVSYAAS
jgi:hypothetical protein